MPDTDTVWKYSLPIRDEPPTLRVPVGAEVLHVGQQNLRTEVVMWARVRPDQPLVERQFIVRGTGHPVPADARYVGTVVLPLLVWHVFRVD